MNPTTRSKLLQAWQYCDNQDKSTEFMIQYMQDFAEVDFNCVIDFIQNITVEERQGFIHTSKPRAD